VNVENPIEAALREAGAKHWCTKAMCTTCGATPFRERIAQGALAAHETLAEALIGMDLSAWYAVEHVGGAIALVFGRLADIGTVDEVLADWRSRVEGHTRIIDSVVFHLLRRGLMSEPEGAAWLTIARAEALATFDPSLLETLAYALGSSMTSDRELMAAANRQRRGYSPLHRALLRTVDSMSPEA
jgi:hypothetical protein